MGYILYLPASLPAQCDIAQSVINMWNLFSLPLNPGWPHDFIWAKQGSRKCEPRENWRTTVEHGDLPFVPALGTLRLPSEWVKPVCWRTRGHVKMNRGNKPQGAPSMPPTHVWTQPRLHEPAAVRTTQLSQPQIDDRLNWLLFFKLQDLVSFALRGNELTCH